MTARLERNRRRAFDSLPKVNYARNALNQIKSNMWRMRGSGAGEGKLEQDDDQGHSSAGNLRKFEMPPQERKKLVERVKGKSEVLNSMWSPDWVCVCVCWLCVLSRLPDELTFKLNWISREFPCQSGGQKRAPKNNSQRLLQRQLSPPLSLSLFLWSYSVLSAQISSG